MNIYVISDTHFNHSEKMCEWCGRPKNYEEKIWKNLKQINESDLLIHLGDITIGKDEEVHKRLQEYDFRKILVKGNHDHKSNTWYLQHGWSFVCNQFNDQLFGKRLVFSHLPVVWDGYYDINIHGHFHNSDHRRHEPGLLAIKNSYQKLYAVEYQEYKPVRLDKFIL